MPSVAGEVIAAALCRTARAPCTRRTSLASLVALAAGALLVFAVGRRRAPKRTCHVACRRVGRVAGDTPGQPRRDLLEQPAVAIRILERGERAVAAMLGIRPADPDLPKQVRFVRASVHTASVVDPIARAIARKAALSAGIS